MEDGSSRMRPVGTLCLARGVPTGDPQIFSPSPTARRAARLDTFARFFRRHDLR